MSHPRGSLATLFMDDGLGAQAVRTPSLNGVAHNGLPNPPTFSTPSKACALRVQPARQDTLTYAKNTKEPRRATLITLVKDATADCTQYLNRAKGCLTKPKPRCSKAQTQTRSLKTSPKDPSRDVVHSLTALPRPFYSVKEGS